MKFIQLPSAAELNALLMKLSINERTNSAFVILSISVRTPIQYVGIAPVIALLVVNY